MDFCWAWDSTILLWCQKTLFQVTFWKFCFTKTTSSCLACSLWRGRWRRARWNLFAGKMNFSTGFVTSGAGAIICSILRENPETRSWICILVWRQWTRKQAGQGGRTGTNMIIMWAKTANTNTNMNLSLQSVSFGLNCIRLFSLLSNLKYFAIILKVLQHTDR